MIPYFDFSSFSLGFLTFQTWGTLAAAGFLLAGLIAWQKIKKQKLDENFFLNFALGILISSLFFARLFYVFFGGELEVFLRKPWFFFALWQGGMSAVGGFFGAGLILVWFLINRGRGKKIFAPTIWPYIESMAYAFPFGWMLGRLGCFLIHDHPGRLTNSLLAVNFPNGARWDMGLLEMLALLPLVILFLFFSQKERPTGFYSLWLLFWYGISRFFLDFLRANDLPASDPRWWSLTLGQWGSIVLIILGIVLWKKRGRFA